MFRHPFTMIVAGATGSGKTQWLSRFLRKGDEMITDCPQKILYAYGELNSKVLELQTVIPGLVPYYGVPSVDIIKEERDANGRLLLILDDLMLNVRSAFLDTLFTKGSHNWNVSVVFVTQHLFTKEMRTARQNAHYLILMRNPAGELQVRNLAAQLFPGRLPFFLESYRDATQAPFSYLLVDMHPQTADDRRVRAHIYPDETNIVYIPKTQ